MGLVGMEIDENKTHNHIMGLYFTLGGGGGGEYVVSVY